MPLLFILAILLAASPAAAGSCRYGSYGSKSVVACQGGYYSETGGYGSRTWSRSWGIRNGGVARYPGSGWPSYQR